MVYRTYGPDQKLLSENAAFRRTWAQLVIRASEIDDVVRMARFNWDEYGDEARRRIWVAILNEMPPATWEKHWREIFMGEWRKDG